MHRYSYKYKHMLTYTWVRMQEQKDAGRISTSSTLETMKLVSNPDYYVSILQS